MVCLRRPYHFKLIEGCLPQILLGPFFNTLSHSSYSYQVIKAIVTTLYQWNYSSSVTWANAKHSKTNRLQETIKYKTSEECTQYSY